MHDVPEVCAKLPQMAAYSSTFEMVVPSGILSVGLQSPIVDSALASRYTSHRVTCPRSWTSEPSNLEQALAPMLVQASQKCPHRHDSWMFVSRHQSLSVARRRHPTAQTVHRNARQKTSVHTDICHWCHEIHLQDLPNLARASALSCHEQIVLELELGSVTEDSSDQKHTASWIMLLFKLEYPPLASVRDLLLQLNTDGSRTPPSAWTPSRVASLFLCLLFADDGCL